LEKNRELNILYDITRFLSEPMSVDELSQGFIERVRATFEAKAASVRLFDTDIKNLLLVNHHGLSEEFVTDEAVLRCGECVCGQAILGDSTIVRSTADAGDAKALAACARAGFGTVSAIPVNHNKRTLGIFNLYFVEKRSLSSGDREVLQSLGQHLGMAIENARLRSREREMAVSEERNLIARELHDSVAQGLAFLNLQVQILEQALAHGKLEKAVGATGMIHRGVQESYADMRELLQHFRIRFTQPDLDSAVRAALDKFTEQSGVPAALSTRGMGAPLAAEVETQVLYIVQEALSNVRKHAHAGKVEIELQRDPDGLRLTVADDGRGFEPNARPDAVGGEHIGLQIMEERAARIGGRLSIESSPGRGTRVSLALLRPELEKEST
ncbi:MAG: GAF domain-containing protein, partial [Zoogloea sp.]|nr:GAF domain-containing protein [Zoogloea sp.]